jgi:G8 domain-containing protein
MRNGIALLLLAAGAALAQNGHDHARQVHGVPGGVPEFCANPTITSVASGAWSDPATWSTKKTPGANDRVLVAAGHNLVYDAASDARLACVELRGNLSFKTDASTRMKAANIMVMDEGSLEVGSSAKPVAPDATAEIVIADQAIDHQLDPAELGSGIESLGKITMHGAMKSPTFVRLAKEPLAGQTTLTLSEAAATWKAGDHIVLPDTRQLREKERGDNYKPQHEKLEIASIAGTMVTLTSALKYDHKGAGTPDGKLEFLPHAGNLSRNVVIRSENPAGTRGHMIFMSRSQVDLRYVEVREMGRTKMGVLDNTEFDDQGRVLKLGKNQIGRYAIHFHHYFGPKQTPSNGYQFTLVGNSVDGAPKWGVTVHNSHYGLIQDNVVYNTRGAGIVTEDGTESFNVFDHNFAMRSEGSGEFAPRSGYGGAAPDPGGEGAGFWFRGPNNYIRNNVAANADVFGFGLAAGSLDTVRVPKFKGADMSNDAETVAMDTTEAPVLEFANNEAYGAIQTGAACGWNGDIKNFHVWNASRHGLTAAPTDKLLVDSMIVRGDPSVLANEFEVPAGVWVSNYLAKSIIVRNADVQGVRSGVLSPFFRTGDSVEPGRGDSSLLIENGYFRDYIGVVVGTSYASSSKDGSPLKKAIVRSSVFEPLNVVANQYNPPAAISMNYRMAGGDVEARDPVMVYDFNKKAGDNFKVYYSLEAPERTAPCHEARQGIGGWACK